MWCTMFWTYDTFVAPNWATVYSQVDSATRRLQHMGYTYCGSGAILTLEWSPDNQLVAALGDVPEKGTRSNCIYFCNVSNGLEIENQVSGSDIVSITWGSDSSWLFHCGHDQNVVRSYNPVHKVMSAHLDL
jgi:WD40 repeat protein